VNVSWGQIGVLCALGGPLGRLWWEIWSGGTRPQPPVEYKTTR